jgi:two-component system sensor histidine kinase YesM
MFKRLKYQGRIFFTYSIVVIILISISTYFVQKYITGILKNTESDQLSELTRQTVEKLDILFTQMDRASDNIASNPQVVKILSTIDSEENGSSNYFLDHPSAAGDIKNAILTSRGYQTLQDRISVLTNKGDFAKIDVFDSVYPAKKKILSLEWVQNAYHSDQDTFLLKPHQDDWVDYERICFSYVRVIKSLIDKPIGLVEIQYPQQSLADILKFDTPSPISLVLLDQEGNLFYEQGNDGITLAPDYFKNYQVNFGQTQLYSDKIDNEKIIFSIRKLPAYGLSVILVERENDFLLPVREMAQGIYLAGGVLLLLTLVTIYGVSKRLTKPISELRKSIEAIDLKTLSADFKVDTDNNEIALLTSTFDLMLSKIRNTSSELLQSRTRELKANYSALQSQVNPHFLYNILTVIGTMGQQYGNHEILHICSALTQMLSYSTSMESGYATLRQEMEHVNNYLKLMKYRYLDFLKYDIAYDDDFQNIIVPKLSILPLVENCFQHGFSDMEPPYEVRVHGTIENGRWVVEVRDNGCGFSEEVLESIKTKMANIKREFDSNSFSPDLTVGGLGLLNTFARFRLYYSGQEILAFANDPEGGGVVTISGLIENAVESVS